MRVRSHRTLGDQQANDSRAAAWNLGYVFAWGSGRRKQDLNSESAGMGESCGDLGFMRAESKSLFEPTALSCDLSVNPGLSTRNSPLACFLESGRFSKSGQVDLNRVGALPLALQFPHWSVRSGCLLARRSDVHEEASVKTGARRLRDFPDIHSASSATAERHARVCGRSHSTPRRRNAPRRTSGCDLGPAPDLDLDSLLRGGRVCAGPGSRSKPETRYKYTYQRI